LNDAGRSQYRSSTMRYAYLAQDRPECQFSAKELARSMNTPTAWDAAQLRRAVRYLIGAGRLVQRFNRQPMPTELVCYTDSDHAGCLKTRKSTSASFCFWGKHLVRSTSTTQAVISLSTGESEFYAAVKTSAIGIGLKALLADMNIVLQKPVLIRMDASAGLGVIHRRGAGRIRHIHTPSLWLQRAHQNGVVLAVKWPGVDNVADLGTKHVEVSLINKFLTKCGFVKLGGRSEFAFKAQINDLIPRVDEQNSFEGDTTLPLQTIQRDTDSQDCGIQEDRAIENMLAIGWHCQELETTVTRDFEKRDVRQGVTAR
jgi:hypothetical protein